LFAAKIEVAINSHFLTAYPFFDCLQNLKSS
jgi:hypothetical protein